MRSREQPLVGMNIQEEDEIMNINANRVNLIRGSIEEGVGGGVENGSDGVEDKASMVKGDLQRFGNGSGVDTVGRG